MRILFLALDIDLSCEQGDSIHALSLARSLLRSGNRVHLIVGADRAGIPSDGLEISVCPKGQHFAVLQHAYRVARRFRPDVIYERRFSPKVSAALSLALHRPYVVEINGLVEAEAAMQGRPLSEGPVARLKASLRKLTMRRAAAVVTVTEGLRDVIVQEYGVAPTKVFTVENGVDATLFRPMDRSEARVALGLAGGQIICFVGNLAAWQGLRVVLDALLNTPGSVRLLIVGDGRERQNLTDYARALGLLNRVEFVGRVPHDEVPLYMAAADVCVVPFTSRTSASKSSSLMMDRAGRSPLKLYEYLASARPVVLTAVAGARKLVEVTGSGMVVPPDEPMTFGRAIRQVLENPSFALAANRASEIVRRDHSWDAVASAVGRVLATVTDESVYPTYSTAREGHGAL